MKTGGLIADALVIGGGPAGCLAAGRLAAAGIDTLLIDHRAAPVTPMQTLTMSAFRLLRSLGVEVGTDCVGMARSMLVDWPNGREENSAPSSTNVEALVVDRSPFDAALRAWAIRCGARVVAGRVIGWSEGDHGEKDAEIQTPGGIACVEACAIIVATGRAASFGLHRQRLGPTTLALIAELDDFALPAEICVEAVDDGWIWATQHCGSTLVVAVTSPTARHHRADALQSLFRQSATFSVCTVDQCRIRTTDATPSIATSPPRDRVHLIGDAAYFLDPLSGHGLSAALRSAVQTSDALIRDGTDIAHATTIRSSDEVARHHGAIAARYYLVGAERFRTAFWVDRSSTVSPLAMSSAARKSTDVASPTMVPARSAIRA